MVGVRGVTVDYLRPGEGICLKCVHCNRTRVIARDDLVRLVGGSADLSTLYTRMKCLVCRRPPVDMWLTWPSRHDR
jgi:hypothetical protein